MRPETADWADLDNAVLLWQKDGAPTFSFSLWRPNWLGCSFAMHVLTHAPMDFTPVCGILVEIVYAEKRSREQFGRDQRSRKKRLSALFDGDLRPKTSQSVVDPVHGGGQCNVLGSREKRNLDILAAKISTQTQKHQIVIVIEGCDCY
ncbi:MAG: hypothetical protein GY820_42035 [Gammaproteobacteria bacterium]|nr:hypothetical protein [Gammaproteobacteria bacterium]